MLDQDAIATSPYQEYDTLDQLLDTKLTKNCLTQV